MTKETAEMVAELRSRIRYEPDTGKMFWLPKTSDTVANRRWNGRCAGREIRSPHAGGYIQLGVKVGGQEHKFLGHRVAFAIHHGRWPDGDLDHRNNIRTDNWIDNLREASGNNNKNIAAVRTKSGLKGAYRHKCTGRWFSQILVGEEQKYLGIFDTAEEAAAAYDAAAVKYFQDFARTNASMGLL